MFRVVTFGLVVISRFFEWLPCTRFNNLFLFVSLLRVCLSLLSAKPKHSEIRELTAFVTLSSAIMRQTVVS